MDIGHDGERAMPTRNPTIPSSRAAERKTPCPSDFRPRPRSVRRRVNAFGGGLFYTSDGFTTDLYIGDTTMVGNTGQLAPSAVSDRGALRAT